MAANTASVIGEMHAHIRADMYVMQMSRQGGQIRYDQWSQIMNYLRELDSIYAQVGEDLELRGITPTMGKTYEETLDL